MESASMGDGMDNGSQSDKPDDLTSLEKQYGKGINRGTWFRSAESGVWYPTIGRAGSIDAIRIDGVTFCNGQTVAF